MVRRSLLVGALVGAFSLALGGAVWQVTRPDTLRVAVGPADGEDLRLLEGAQVLLRRHGADVRLKVVPVADPLAAGKLLETRDAELAVVRSDAGLPADGQTVAILHRNAAVLLAMPGETLEDVGGLEGRTIGLLGNSPANERLLEAVLKHYEVTPTSVSRLMLSPEEVPEAVRTKRVAALLVVAPVPSLIMSEALAAVAAAGRGPATFVPIAEAEAMALQDPVYESMEIVRGSFGGNPPRPADAITTLALTYRLMAHADVADNKISNLARHIFEMRSDLAHAVPQANRIEAPDTKKGSRLPVHPGAAAYFDSEEESFMDRYGDWFYIVAMLIGFLGSAAAALVSRLRSRHQEQSSRLEHLLRILKDARAAGSADALDALEQEADDVFAETLAGASHSDIDAGRLAAFSLALDQVRLGIAERRRTLQERPPAPAMVPPLRIAP